MVLTRSKSNNLLSASETTPRDVPPAPTDTATSSGLQESTETNPAPPPANAAQEVSLLPRTEDEKRSSHRSLSHSHRTSKAPSRRSGRSSKRLLAELELKERLAELELKEIQAAAKLEKARMEKLQAELSSSEDDDYEDENHETAETTVKQVNMWLERQVPPLPPAAAPRPQCRPLSPPRLPARPVEAIEESKYYEQRAQENYDYMENGHRASRKSSPARSSRKIDIKELAAAITESTRAATRQPPKYLIELPYYSGRSDEWLTFKATFTQTQDSFTAAENVARLRRCLKGSALDAVSALLITTSGPDDIIKALERRFGRPETLVLAEIEKIKSLPRVTENPRDLCIFANKIANIVAAIEVLKKPLYLHSPEMLRSSVEKLTPILKNKWYDYATTRTDEDTPELKKLTEFLNCEADKCAAYASLETDHEKPARKRMERTFVAEVKTKRDGCPACKKDHHLLDCPTFLNADVNTRWEMTKSYRICFRCLKSTHRRITCRARPCGQEGCTLRHHKLLHVPKKPATTEPDQHEQPPPTSTPAIREEIHTTTIKTVNAARSVRIRRRTYLKVVPVVLSGPKGQREILAFLDDGSSTSIIDTETAEELGLDGPVEPISIQGINGDETLHDDSKSVTVKIRGKHVDEDYEIEEIHTAKNIKLFTQTVRPRTIEGCKHLQDLKDELTYENAAPKMLIGQDHWYLITARDLREGHRDQLAASRTLLGWVLHGTRKTQIFPVVFCAHLSTAERAHDRLEAMMKKHFEIESLGIEPRKQESDPEQLAIKILERKSQRLPDGRFETGLLWRDENAIIPNNYEDTLKRLKSLEKKLDRDENLKIKYEERMENLLKSNYAERATTPPTGGRTWYLAHFAVIKPEKELPRLVHDAAARSHGLSLNDMLLSGPDLLQSLPGVIMKFRQYPIAVSADIKEMFMQVKIIEEDRDALRFLWRGDRRDDAPPDEYRMTSLVFGSTSSPCTALYIKNRNAQENAEENPTAARAIQENHYMDDYLHSFTSLQEAKEITTAVDRIHKKAGFELRGWASNCEQSIAHLATPTASKARESARATSGNAGDTESAEGEVGAGSARTATVEIGGNEIEKTLGLLWHVKEDTLGFRVNKKRVPPEVLEGLREPTKREALSLIMSIFDPLGLISPITTPAKRIMQDTWKYKTGWDETIPPALLPRWKIWLASLRDLHLLRVPRCYDCEPVAKREIHTFVDASEEAYAAAVYLRTTRADGSVHVAITAAKSRVTPTKPISIPRLELQAAVMGARLTKSVENGHDFDIARKTYWSDSRTALAWIRGEPRTYKSFVAHRLAEIEDLTKKDEWRWVPTSLNVADDSTRDTPSEFTPQHRWFTGPEFLYQSEDSWPTEKKQEVQNTGEEREICMTLHTTSPDVLIDFNRFSKFSRLVRTMGRVLQFVDLCRRRTLIAAARHKRTRRTPDMDENWRMVQKKTKEVKTAPLQPLSARRMVPLKTHFLYGAERLLIKIAQKQSYSKLLLPGAFLPGATVNNGPLAGLSVMLDGEGLLRLRGRVNEAEAIDYETANPAILDGRHRYTKLYIHHVHEKLHHGGVEIVVNELRQRLWIVRIRPAVKEVLKSCPPCRLRKAKPASPSTGNLPAARLAHHERPYSFTGLDYFGPIEVTVNRHREKRHVALFTCMTSRAVALDVVASLSTDSAINVLRRFIARHGCPTEIWSDNATCFRSADRELTDAWRALEEEATRHRITWRFLPPAAPFMAGAWERMVRTVKEALRVTLREQHPSDETLATLLAEVEATVNSRPLTHVAVTPEAPPALTPNMILLGPNCYVPAPGKFEDTDVNARAHWRRAQRLADIFWRRWVREYLPLLQHRREPHATGTNPKIGDLVVICDSNLPRNTWPRGRVTATYPGKDGEVRVVDVTTSSGRVLRRPTKRIIVLPVDSQDATAGECARRDSTNVNSAV